MLLPPLLGLTPTAADADDDELANIHGQRRQRARRRFFQAVLEDDDRGVHEGIRRRRGLDSAYLNKASVKTKVHQAFWEAARADGVDELTPETVQKTLDVILDNWEDMKLKIESSAFAKAEGMDIVQTNPMANVLPATAGAGK